MGEREMRTEMFSAGGDAWLLRGWPSPVETDALIVIHHGLGEHSGRYNTFARHLADIPAHIWSYDARGHGQSSGKRGHADGLQQLADDLEALLPALVERAGAKRLFLLGHSMGAAAIGWYLTSRGLANIHPAIRAIALSAPPLVIPPTLDVRVKTAAARLLVRLAPRLTLSSGLDPNGISSDPSEVARYTSDPFNHDRLSIRLGLSLIDDAPKIAPLARELSLPLLAWHGTDDPIADVQGSRALFAAWGGTDKLLIELPGYLHESHHERPDRTEHLFERIRSWLMPRLAPGDR